MRRERQTYDVPVYCLSAEEPVRTIQVQGFDRFEAYLRALDEITPPEYTDEDQIEEATH